MDLEFVESHPGRVLEEFRRGRFDSVSTVSRADEQSFFELCRGEGMLDALARRMPTARKKEEVPRAFILAANLSLKLHGENAFLGWERVARSGGLLAALDPAMTSRHLDAAGASVVLRCEGFNAKSRYARRAPCDQDTLRKYVRDVGGGLWQQWFNGPVQEVFRSRGFFDPEGVFVGDASYLFVPDNESYEESVRMWFDEHNHPVDVDRLPAAQRRKARLERCYKMVSLLHLRGEHFVCAAVALVPGNRHELPVLYDLVEGFVARLGRGVINKLIVDRGLIDGARIAYCKSVLGVDVLVPLKRSMDLWAEAWALCDDAGWVPAQGAPAPRAAARGGGAPTPDIARRERARQQTLARRREMAGPPEPARRLVSSELCAVRDLRWDDLPVPFHAVLMRESYADGHREQWGLLTTEAPVDPQAAPRDYARRAAIEERHRQLKCFHDLSEFRSRSLNVITAQLVFVLLTYTLRQWQLWKSGRAGKAGLHPESIQEALDLADQHVYICRHRSYARVPLVSFLRMALELKGAARRAALATARRLERSFLTPPANPRPPPP